MSSLPSFKREESSSFPAVDETGLPLDSDVVTPVASSAHNSLGEASNNRSVGMAFLAPPPLTTQRSIGSSGKSLGLSGEFSMMPPPPRKAAPTKPVITKVTPSLALSLSSPTWNIPPGAVKCKPDNYPLDPMATMIMNSNAQSIAKRISECLRRRSIAASYGEVRAKAKCVSPDGVEFRIRLFAGKGKYTGGVIVEIQRRSGWATSYNKDCHAVMESAEFDSVGDSDDSFSEDVPMVFDDAPQKSSLSLTKLLLSGTSQDSMVLGLESICSLTDPRKYGKEAALSTASAIFLEQDNYIVNEILRDLLILRNWNGVDFSSYPEEFWNPIGDVALKAITNCISILSRERILGDVLKFNNWIEKDLVAVLLTQVRNSSSRPHVATMASRCMNDITNNSNEATNTAIKMGVLDILEQRTNSD